eukprot:gnl/TRDRNA2_/TRDRNA2_39507_c0_seq1.p1 gnl/TRDRNA2_/TRDRNA2_39507_c0~~gnl/TRDRNA2_/TRDRNA2_39507_c0_seq1.p1  ORF type:complete len:300 (+),score=97.56 gnl/TRDRNA2_/TRDRNA2_39507_c0_seq1:109-1008(+)
MASLILQKLTLALLVTAVLSTQPTAYDDLNLLQVRMTQVKVKKAELEQKSFATDKYVIDGKVAECASDVDAGTCQQAGENEQDSAEVQKAAATESRQQDSFAIALRCILNLMSLAVFLHTLHWFLYKRNEIPEGADEEGEADEDLEPLTEEEDPWPRGVTALHKAAKEGSMEDAKQLLKRGARVDGLDDEDETPLHYAARAGAIDVCELLLAQGGKLNPKNSKEWTPLVAAEKSGKMAMCVWLLARGANQGDLDTDLFVRPTDAESTIPAEEAELNFVPEQPSEDFSVNDFAPSGSIEL